MPKRKKKNGKSKIGRNGTPKFAGAQKKRGRKKAEADKKSLLKPTKGKEKEYQKLLASRQKDAATIRSQLFMLRGSPAIPFEKALEYANKVSQITGIRPAFLLGVIAEESNLGANVGTGNWKTELADSVAQNSALLLSNLPPAWDWTRI